MNDILLHKVFPVLLSVGMPLWIYCIWFLNKYDKDSNRLMMLLVLNLYYVPFYLFRIRKIKREQRIRALSEDIYDRDFINMSRASIVDTLTLWSSKEEQLDFKSLEVDISISEELFQQWDSVYRIDIRIIDEAFGELERELLKTFDKTILISREKYSDRVPDINEFQNTNDWKVMNRLAKEILKEIR
ncbi:MAG: hypothetical protein N4A72_13080 [Bacteroidales bacterium]|jgi:hypothetical protein|nr:hypothetical protein [Bacteroidales bacterium]